MSRAPKQKNTQALQRQAELDDIVTQLRTILHRATSDVVLAGDLLILSRALFASEHGEWQSWLAENFDLSYRTARRYVTVAEYVAQKAKVTRVTFADLSPTVLYALAAGRYTREQEAAILAATDSGRVDQTRATAIANSVKPALASPPDVDEVEKREEKQRAAEEERRAIDEEVKKIIDDKTPRPPPPQEEADAPSMDLQQFDKVGETLLKLYTKPKTTFAATKLSPKNISDIIAFFGGLVPDSDDDGGSYLTTLQNDYEALKAENAALKAENARLRAAAAQLGGVP